MTTAPGITPEAARDIMALADRRAQAARMREAFPDLSMNQQFAEIERLAAVADQEQEEPARTPDQFKGRTATMTFRQLVPAATRQSEAQRVSFDLTLTSVYFNFPPGPSFLVEVRLLRTSGRATRQVLPSQDNTFFAFDNTLLPMVGLAIDFLASDNIVVEWSNYDDTFPHTVPVTCVFQPSLLLN